MTGFVLILLCAVLLGLAFVSAFTVHQQRLTLSSSPTAIAFPTPVPPFPTPAPLRVCTRVVGGHLNVRRGPGLDQAVVAWLEEGMLVWPTGRIAATWQEIELPVSGLSGWVNNRYLCGGDHDESR
jgi:hypothetical protein